MTNPLELNFASVEDAILDFANGKFIIVADDEDRENEGDLICSADLIDASKINFMVTKARGLVCLALDEHKAQKLDLPPMVQHNSTKEGTAFTVTIDANYDHGITTGVSASDRAATIKLAASETSVASDFIRPGHIMPLIARSGGVLRRAGHTEAGVDLAKLANLNPSAVICEIMNEDGSMARLPDLIKFAHENDLKIITIAQLISYRLSKEKFVSREACVNFPCKYGDFKLYSYKNLLDNQEHVALVLGEVENKSNVLIRVHSECLTGDVFGSLRCDCGPQLDNAMTMIASAKCGVLVYLRQEGRGIGLANKIKAYALQDTGLDTVEANQSLGFKPDLRDYGVGAQILHDLGLTSVKIITNNPRKIVGLVGYGLNISDRVPMIPACNGFNVKYLETKREKLGHLIENLTL